MKLDKERLLSKELITAIKSLAEGQINLVVNRKGEIVEVTEGQLTADILSDLRRRESNKRLAGLRILSFNSYLPGIEKIDLLLHYRLDNLTYYDWTADRAQVIFPEVEQGRIIGVDKEKMDLDTLLDYNYLYQVEQLEGQLEEVETVVVSDEEEKAVLVGKNKASLKELARLTTTADVEVLDKIEVRRGNIDPGYYIGRGKLAQVNKTIFAVGANVVIFDDELTPAQHSNLEEILEVKVLDRTQLILDIFASHAHTKEGKLQVELAQLEYLLPRLTGKGEELSRLGGGIGTRGPGETKLEIDRRRIRKRIHRLKEKLVKVRQTREVQRQDRSDPVISLVGYTNAGKSTLLNLLTGAEVEVKDKLFATLDSTLRKIQLPVGRQVVVSDTVGFINKLPHDLVAAFKATLEEIKDSDLLIHVVDSNHDNLEHRMQVVYDVLEDLKVLDKEIITVFNKADLVDDNQLKLLQQQTPNSLAMSALTGAGKDKLLEKMSEFVAHDMVKITAVLPYEEAQWVDKLHQQGQVITEEYKQGEIEIEAKISKKLASKLEDYILKSEPLF
ncbi:GTPase HflX [Halanaerobacter jeridensis]|uniref:GTPase HflX n=1 Tax=Halanaerobacter jeridensis TaxID=706427 RepID=A0A938XU54_9FIRM|nr:GTPase HflX [Halanaerobacter jeridensis]MBM7557575.1 GTP-binding protein HflX [Halanaerobacter jeridensis]